MAEGHGGISIIVPVYNESERIPSLAARLKALEGGCEILFVDGGSTDGTGALVEKEGFRCVRSPSKGRANQMNCGADLAGGRVLWFLHADSLPPADALEQIHCVLRAGSPIGCFPIRFDSSHPLMAVCGFLSNLRVRLRGIAFGDQGIFLEADLFRRLGGFAPIPLMEDYRLSLDVKKAGLRIVLAGASITTSERRFASQGRLRTMWKMQRLQHRYRRGGDIDAIAKAYED